MEGTPFGEPVVINDQTEVGSENEEQQEKETPAGDSPTEEKKPVSNLEGDQDKKPEEEEEGEEEAPESEPETDDNVEDNKELQAIQAETERVKKQALDELVNWRARRRELRGEPNKVMPAPSIPATSGEEMDEEVAKQLDTYLRTRGYVPKEELKKELELTVLSQGQKESDSKFFNSHPEYIYSKELSSEFDDTLNSLKESRTAEEYEKNLRLAHEIVKQNHPDRFPSSKGIDAAKKPAYGSGGKGGVSKPSSYNQTVLTPMEIAELRRNGWSEEDIKDINKNLIDKR